MKRARTPLEIDVPLRNNTKRGKMENAVQAAIHEPFPLGTPLRNYLDDVKRFLSSPHPQVLDEAIAYLRLSYGFTIAALPEALQELALYRNTEHKLTLGTLAKLSKFVSCTGKVMNYWSALPTSERENYHGLPGWFAAWDRRTDCSDLRGWKVERYLAADLYETVAEALSDYTPLENEEQKQVELDVSEDWARPFLGVAAIKLRDHLLSQKAESETLNTRNYARAFPVLQSSGTGKSRTVVQLSTLEPGFMICVRPEPRQREVTSQPPRDDHIGQWLLTAQEDTPFTSHAKAAAWLAALADTMANFYKEEIARASNGPPDWKDFKVQMARFLAPGRALDYMQTDFLEDVDGAVHPQHETDGPSTSSCPSYSGITPSSSGSSLSKGSTRRTLLRKISEAAQKTMESATYQPSKSRQEDLSKISESFGLDLNAAFTRLENQLDPYWNEDAFFHLAIDECSALQQNLHVVRRLWAELKSSRFWLLFLDTNAQISETCSMTATATSARVGREGKSLLRPFLSLPQNLALLQNDTYLSIIRGESGQYDYTHADILSFLPQMGRPLLADKSFQGGHLPIGGLNGQPSTSIYSIMKKLLKDRVMDIFDNKTRDRLEPEETVTLVGQRMPLRLLGTGSLVALKFAENMVAGRMRIVHDVAEWPEVISTAVPDEPLLSLAATAFFRSDPGRFWSDAIENLAADGRQLNGIDIGESGEEYVRAILSLSSDVTAALSKPIASNDDTDQKQQIMLRRLDPIRLSTFLTVLLGENLDPKPLATTENYWINFTHFTRLAQRFNPGDNPSEMPLSYLVEMWTRQTAILGPANQACRDAVLPVLYSTTEPIGLNAFEPKNISFLALQIKLRQTACTVFRKAATDPIKYAWKKDFSRVGVESLENRDLAVFQIFVELGLKSSAVEWDLDEPLLTKIRVRGNGITSFPVLSALERLAQNGLQQWIGRLDKLKAPLSERRDELCLRGEAVALAMS